jgi:hypothetical protein
MLEIRTVAGPARIVQCVLSGAPVHRLVACAACPAGVPAAVPEASLVTDQHLATSVKNSGCCWRTRCEGITLPPPGGMTGLDPVRWSEVRSWCAGRMSRWAR